MPIIKISTKYQREAYPSRPRDYIITMDPNLWTPDRDDIVDELLTSLNIQDAETDETELDESHVFSEIIGTNTDSDGREDKLTKWSMWT